MADRNSRPTRAESFLGIHFDFHANTACTEVGKTVTSSMIEGIIEAVAPDYVQCDCKGHPGYSSYPTTVGNPAPGIVKDQLRIWRDVTAKHGVALYVHYSGVIDARALELHPEWARIDENDELDQRVTSTFGAYVDRLLIPQLTELIDDYDIDGVRIDGDCWGTARDYGQAAALAFKDSTGLEVLPKSPENPHYVQFSQFCRDQFRRYLARYTDALHEHKSRFQVASNWSYTSFMPEPVSTNVDYISGDYPLQNSVNAARLQARCLVHQDRPWDLMAWSFAGVDSERCWSTKSPEQLKQEAAVVLSQGGGFQAYFRQKRDGAIMPWQMKLMSEVARFCRERQPYCHHAQPVPQVALLYSGHAHYRQAERLFQPTGGELDGLTGVLNALLDSQMSVEITMEHHLRGRTSEYPLIVVPEWNMLDPDMYAELVDYVHDGGNLLLVGPYAVRQFQKELGIGLQDEPCEVRRWLEHEGWLAGVHTVGQSGALPDDAEPIGRLYRDEDNTGPYDVAASLHRVGEGQIAAVYINLGGTYLHARTTVVRDFIGSLAGRLLPEPTVQVRGSHLVDVAISRIDGQLAINLLNTAGVHADPSISVFDEVPPIGPLELTIRCEVAPERLVRQPSGVDLDFAYSDGKATATLDRLHIHEVILVEI